MLRKAPMGLLAIFLSLAAGTNAKADVVLSNSPTFGTISVFGSPDTTTYGEVFTAPTTGELTSFSLFLSSTIGNLIGGIGVWNGTGVSSVLYTSSPLASSLTNTFSPDIQVVAGQRYVAFLSVDGVAGATGQTSMPLGTATVGLDGFVYNNSECCGGGGTYANQTWSGLGLESFDNVRFSATFSPAAVPGPTVGAGASSFALAALLLCWLVRRRSHQMV